MSKLFFFLLLIFFCGKLSAQQAEWAKSFPIENNNHYQAMSDRTALDKENNIFVMGSFISPITVGTKVLTPGTVKAREVFLTKYDTCGNQLWAIQTQTSRRDSTLAWDIATDEQGDVYLTGYTNRFASLGGLKIDSEEDSYVSFLAKYSGDGVIRWVKAIDNVKVHSFSINRSGNIAIIGWKEDSTEILRYNSNGEMIWRNAVSVKRPHSLTEIILDEQNNVFMSGGFEGDIQIDSLILSTQPGSGAHQYLLKCNKDGQAEWLKDLNNDVPYGYSYSYKLSISPKGRLYVSASFSETYMISHFTTDGKTVWNKNYIPNYYPTRLTIDESENIYFGYLLGSEAELEGFLLKDNIYYLIKCNSVGNVKSVKKAVDTIHDIVINDSKHIYLSGSFSGKLRIDAVEITSTVPALYVAKFGFFDLPSSPDFTICSGEQVAIGGPPLPNTVYEWWPSDLLSSASSPNPVVKGFNNEEIPVVKTFIVKASKNCPAPVLHDYDTVQVKILPNYESLTIKTGSRIVCPFTGGIRYWIDKRENYDYEWKVEGGEIATGQGNDTVSVNWFGSEANAWVEITATHSIYKCSRTSRLAIKIDELLKPDKPIGDTAFCVNPGQEYPYYTSALNNKSTYQWSTNDPSAIMGERILSSMTVVWTTPGIKKLWILEASKTPCIGSSDTLIVEVHPLPDSKAVIEGPANVGHLARNVDYEVDRPTSSSYEWILDAGGEIIEGQGSNTIRIDWKDKGIFDLIVRETSEHGCIGEEIRQTILVEELFIPNVITPNGDQLNEFLVIDKANDYPNNKIEIYNRWGDPVFAQTDYDNRWNANGNPGGTYYYVFKTGALTYKGWIQVIR